MSRHNQALSRAAASILALSFVAGTAAAQPGDYPPPRPDYSAQPHDYAPPPGEYAPPPRGYERNGSVYDYRAQAADRDYARRYNDWAARNCVDRRNNDRAAGAVIGGVLGAIIGSNVAGHHQRTEGAVAGGALGAIAGAAIGANASESRDCPPGYVVRHGARRFYYPGYDTTVVYGPSWYSPWVFADGRWTYTPYRYWYWDHRDYWRPDWRPGGEWRDRHDHDRYDHDHRPY